MGVGDDQFDPSQPPALELAQELEPEGFSFRAANIHAQHFAPTIGVHSHRDGHGDRDSRTPGSARGDTSNGVPFRDSINVLEIIRLGVHRPVREGVRVLIPGIGMPLHLAESAEISRNAKYFLASQNIMFK